MTEGYHFEGVLELWLLLLALEVGILEFDSFSVVLTQPYVLWLLSFGQGQEVRLKIGRNVGCARLFVVFIEVGQSEELTIAN